MTLQIHSPIAEVPEASEAAASPPCPHTSRSTTAAEAERDAAWDALVEDVPGGDLVQTTAWASIRQRLGTRVCHLRVHAEDGMLFGGCLMQHRSLLPGLRIGAVPRGPLVFANRPDAADRVVQETIRTARRLGIRLLVVQPPEGEARVMAALERAGFRPGGPQIVPTATIRIGLRATEEELLGGLEPKRRQRMRHGLRDGLRTEESDDVEAFHRLHVETAARQGFHPLSLEYLKAQWEVLAPLGMCRIMIASQGGVPVAAEWLTSFAGMRTCRLTGAIPAAPVPGARNATSVLIWAVIQQARRDGEHMLDLGGFDRAAAEEIVAGRAPPPNFLNSPSQFKKSFGGQVALLPGPYFILPGRIARAALTGVAQRLMAHPALQRFAQRMRSG